MSKEEMLARCEARWPDFEVDTRLIGSLWHAEARWNDGEPRELLSIRTNRVEAVSSLLEVLSSDAVDS